MSKWKCVVKSGVNLRSGAGLSSSRISGISYGEEVEVTKNQGTWHYCKKADGTEGWFSDQHTDGTTIMKCINEPVTYATPKQKVSDDMYSAGGSSGIISSIGNLDNSPAATEEAAKKKLVDNTTSSGQGTSLAGAPEYSPGVGNAVIKPIPNSKFTEVNHILDSRYNALPITFTPERELTRVNLFNRAGILDPDSRIVTTKEYVFFTKPDLNLFEGTDTSTPLTKYIKPYPIFDDAYRRRRHILYQLQSSVRWSNGSTVESYNSPFMNLLSNTIKSPIDLPSINAEDTLTSANIYGTAIAYRDTSEKSDDAFEFNIEFEDNKFLDVYMLFKLYDEYERKKHLGLIIPKIEYIRSKVLHDQFAVYKFITSDDGETLLYWAKFYGVYPKGVPRDSMNEIVDGKIKFTIPFRCQFMDDMDPLILTDFNSLIESSLGSIKITSKTPVMPIYDEVNGHANLSYGKIPFIQINTNAYYNSINDPYTKFQAYKLKWADHVKLKV